MAPFAGGPATDDCRILLLSPGTPSVVHLCSVREADMRLLHETLWPTSDMFAVLLDPCTACRCMAAGTLKPLIYASRPFFFSRSVDSLSSSTEKPRSFEAWLSDISPRRFTM